MKAVEKAHGRTRGGGGRGLILRFLVPPDRHRARAELPVLRPLPNVETRCPGESFKRPGVSRRLLPRLVQAQDPARQQVPVGLLEMALRRHLLLSPFGDTAGCEGRLDQLQPSVASR